MKKIKIVYIVSTLKNCGPVQVLLSIVKNLDKKLFDVFIITLSKEPQHSLIDEFVKEGSDVSQVKLSRLKGIFFLKRNTSKIINNINPDLIHSHGIRSDYLCSIFSKKYSTVSTIHNFPNKDYLLRYGKFLGNIMLYFHMKILKKISQPVSISKSISKHLKNRYSLNTSVVYNGIDSKKFFSIPLSAKLKLRDKLKIPADRVVFLSVGHLTQLKDPITTIKAFMISEVEKSLLIFVGDGELLEECKTLSNSSDNIKFVGRQTNVEDYYQASDVFISSSLTEGFGLVVTEAISCGLFCILSDIPAFEEILTYFNKSDVGVLFKNNDSVALSNKLKQAIELLHNKTDCSQIIKVHFSSQAMSDKYSELYQSMINDKVHIT
ncbi:MAG: glycosyltransferase family 4 protein [Candidatus Delongbacteria bacterium]|nr:glycosyltransferase family 4 protein [Candidatus Delongbacteria bacterium]